MIFNYYKITNLKNNKFYIGITEKETEARIKQHFKQLRTNSHGNYKLQQDWNEFGEESFIWETIETLKMASPEEGYYHEYKLIEKYNAIEDGYNILIGGLLNPMYTETVKEKMTQTKQNQVPNVYQLKEIEENVFKIINIFPSQKAIQKQLNFSQANIGRSIKSHSCCYEYFWVNEKDIKNSLKNWKPYRTKITPTAQLNENGEIIKVHHNMVDFCKEYGWNKDLIRNAIKRNGKAKGIKFIRISEEEYYKIKPVTLIK